jgi:F-type H+-transporting ATPase subunit gamma
MQTKTSLKDGLMQIREIRSKIKSVTNTRKITRAMEMMARTKMAKAQRRARVFRPYAERIRAIAIRLHEDKPDYMSAFLARRMPVARVGLIVVSTDRGLCGPLNNHLLLKCSEALDEWQKAGVKVEVSVIGSRGIGPLHRHGANVVARTGVLTAELHFEAFFGTITVPLSGFLNAQLDEVYIAYNHLSSALSYEPKLEKVLPLDELLASRDGASEPLPEYIYEPDPKPVVDTLLLRYVESFIYQAVAENNACEQCARMLAMQAATDNADRMLKNLVRVYNRTRQAAITTELCDIVNGASAV